MKKFILLIMMAVATFTTFAQLGAPKITVRDTFSVVKILYNEMELAPQDWRKYLVEDPVMVDIAGNVYQKKERPYVMMDEYETGYGDFDSYSFSVVCNGETTTLVKWLFHKGEYYARFSLDDYDFYVSAPTGKRNKAQ